MSANQITILLRLTAQNFGAAGTQLQSFAKGLEDRFAKIGAASRVAFVATSVALGFATKEFAEASIEMGKFDAAARRAGDSSGAFSAQINSLADELQTTLGISDDTVRGLASIALNMGTNKEAVAGYIKDAVSLNAITGIGLPQAMKLAIGAGEELYDLLGRMNPQIKAAATEQEKAAIVSAMLANGWASAQAQAGTFGGQLLRLRAASAETAEALGGAMAPALGWLADGLIAVNGRLQEYIKANSGMVGALALGAYSLTQVGSLLPQIGFGIMGLAQVLKFFGATSAVTFASTLAGARALGAGMLAFLATPLGLVTAAVTAATSAFIAYRAAQAAAQQKLEEITDSSEAAARAFREYQDVRAAQRGKDPTADEAKAQAAALDVTIAAQKRALAAAKAAAAGRGAFADFDLKAYDESAIATAAGTLAALQRERDKIDAATRGGGGTFASKEAVKIAEAYEKELAAAKLAAEQAGKTADEKLRAKLAAEGFNAAQIETIAAYAREAEAADAAAERKKAADDAEIARRERIKDQIADITDAIAKERGQSEKAIALRRQLNEAKRRGEIGAIVEAGQGSRELARLQGDKAIRDAEEAIRKANAERAADEARKRAESLATAAARTEDVAGMIGRIQSTVLAEPFKQQAEQIAEARRTNDLLDALNRAQAAAAAELSAIDAFLREAANKARFALA